MRYPLVSKTIGELVMPPLTHTQRYQIAHDIRLGLHNKVIAKGIGCSTRTIEREVKRCGSRAHYCADLASADRARCGQNSAANHPTIPAADWALIEAQIQRKLSPEQALHQLHLTARNSTVYRYLHRLGKQSLLKHLRHYHASQKRGGKTGNMPWAKRAHKIKKRPLAILTRDTIGHLECDSIVGKRNEPHKILVLIDRATRYVRLGWIPDGKAMAVAIKMAFWQHDDSAIPMLSVTTDQGYEFSALPALLPDCLYACDPGKPYQKGQVENMNKLIRQYIPKGMSLRHMTQAKLDWIANELNQRVRKRLSWEYPAALLSRMTVAATC
jgi:transposase, IS30 family